jgi:hypothetical protein
MIAPIDDLIQPLLRPGIIEDIDKQKLWEALNRLSDVGLRAKQVTEPHLGDGSVIARTIADGAIIGAALADGAKTFITDIVFSATDHDTVEWTAGTITFLDGSTATISSGNTGTMSALNYIYYDSAVSVTVLQVTTTYSLAIGDTKQLLCVADNTSSPQEAFFIPAVGVLGINETIIGPSSISTAKIQALAITTATIAANNVTAAKISVSNLSTISLAAGTLTSGTVTGFLIRTASSGARIELDTTNGIVLYDGSDDEIFKIDLDGNLYAWDTFTGQPIIMIDPTSSGGAVGTFSTLSASSGFTGPGASITGLNASQLTTGTVLSARITGSYTGITAVGTIATGVWNGSVIASAYLDADTAHLSGTQTFSGNKTFSGTLAISGVFDPLNYASEAAFKSGAAAGELAIFAQGGVLYLGYYDGSTYFENAFVVT